MVAPPALSSDDFAYISRLLKENSGLIVTPDKAYLINTRLKPIVERNGLATVSALVRQMKSGRLLSLKDEVVDAMTTNESLFFRDSKPFQALIEMMLPTLCERGRTRPIRVWCAAASTGQEPYSIAMMLEDNARLFGGRDISIFATDLSQAALRRARMGEYTAFEVGRGMPADVLQRHFTKTESGHYVVSPKVRARVSFRARNLLEPFDSMGNFDIIFCRNVLIYFDRPTKADVLNRMAKLLPPEGYLVLGGPETTLGLSDAFVRHPTWRNIYTKADKPDSAAKVRDGAYA
ncbi:protein-glutamate O-methyltransferase CheR [Acuticoccus sp. MNP-M23]|uniref:CheR family methyltransferase n=1 Tax=Acuticoccus sp. MNP-M23 TaxID=3072793 RepID=UPI002814CCBC|nr:protein-glutamate O-methyltransferase CheR [Acuticoccus sp. MNP-M23]WMS41823.1 protein-glutamate O-methyltransferase CheR [Acuticoccus sp. MNP-M23]